MGAGAAYVPLDPEYPVARLRLMLGDARPAALLADLDLAPGVTEGLPAALLDLRHLTIEPQDRFVPLTTDPATAPAYVIYTSGSTGSPKGVQVTHAGVVSFLEAMQRVFRLGPRDRGVALTTLSFDIAVLELLLPLTQGASVAILDREVAADPRRLAAALDHQNATLMQATPSTWAMLLDSGWTGRPGLLALAGGEGLPPGLASALRQRVRELWNMYGPTETTVWSACHRVEAGDDPVPLGRPIANTRIHVVDPRGHAVPVGALGEILIGGSGVALGYLNQPEMTAQRFVPDPVEPGAGLVYRTGDLGRWRSDGLLLFAGRLDDQVKLRGHRIELGEIEAVLTRHPAVTAAAAAVRGNDGGERQLAVYYVLEQDRATEPAELREWLARHLPPYMVPQHMVRLQHLPRTPNGKVDRRALPAPTPPAAQPPVTPATPMEHTLAGIWAEVLGLESVGRDDDFYELGGHSILLARAALRVERALGLAVPLRVFFDAPRLADLAARLETIRAVGSAADPDAPSPPAEVVI
jgi:amino acid adenylation domain-containing protein